MLQPLQDEKKIMPHRGRQVMVVLLLGLLAVLVLGTAIGAVFVPFGETVGIILKKWGLMPGLSFSPGREAIIFAVRFPRVLVAALVGAALAVSGAVLQGMFRNPMADPGIIGVSGGASLGAVIAIALGFTAQNIFYLPLAAITGALLASTLIYSLGRGGKMPILTLILAGMAVSTFLGAITSIILSIMHEYQVKEYLFWMVGSLAARRWEHVYLVLPVVAGMIFLIAFARDLNILTLGEEEAQSVGLNPAATRRRLLLVAAMVTALSVCVSGNIGFVGLIVPHIIRLLTGPDHRLLLPASALAGAIFLVGCDLLARTVISPIEIGVGIVTSLLGAPYFLLLIFRARKDGVVI